jgi:hypothetical protein
MFQDKKGFGKLSLSFPRFRYLVKKNGVFIPGRNGDPNYRNRIMKATRSAHS